MRENRSNIQILTLDNFYESVLNPDAGPAFLDMVGLRSKGFGSDYPKSFLPLDRVDFFSRHHIFYANEGGKKTPFGCYKQVALSNCEFYSHEFPLLSFMKSINATEHLQSVEQTIGECKKNKRDVLYGGGLTLTKEFRQRNTSSAEIQELIAALVYQDCRDFNNPVYMTAAANRFKVDQFFLKIGFEPLMAFGKSLAPVPIVSAANEPTVLMRAMQLTDYARSCFEKYQNVIESREVVRAEKEVGRAAA